MANEKGPVVEFGQTWTQKILYMSGPLALSLLVAFGAPLLPGIWKNVGVLLMGIPLFAVTYFVSAGFNFKLSLTPTEIKINDKNRVFINVPMDRVGMLVKNGGWPWPTMWLILRNASVGKEIPAKKVDPKTRELIDAYQKRNPGKTLTYVPIPGGHLRSLPEFVAELKRRIPPLTVDERLPAK